MWGTNFLFLFAYFQLEIIEDELRLKLQIQDIRKQFHSLAQDLENFEQQGSRMPLIQLSPRRSIFGHLQKFQSNSGDNATPSPGKLSKSTTPGKKPISAARARVRALYDAKRARIKAKRAGASLDELYDSECLKASKLRHYAADEDKENIGLPPRPPVPSHFAGGMLASTPAIDSRSKYTCHTIGRISQKLLTPIKEEFRDSPHKLVRTPTRLPEKPLQHWLSVKGVSVKGHAKTEQKDKDFLPQRCYDVTVSPEARRNRYSNNILSHSNEEQVTAEISAQCFTPSPRHSPPASPVKLGSNDTFSELFTSKAIKDISTISSISKGSAREQVSSANLSGAFHSTFNYPLHSTMNCPLSSSFDISPDNRRQVTPEPDTEVSIDVDGDYDHDRKSVKTTISEPTEFIRRKVKRSGLEQQHRKALDDSYMDYQYLNQHPLPSHPSPKKKTPRLTKSKVLSPSDFKTPTRKPQATLCKEHGLHPTFGGPCIFSNEDSVLNLDSSPDDLTFDVTMASPSPKVAATASCVQLVPETDCDSSYLSECVEGDHCSQGPSEGEECLPTYDSRSASIKMLRRQTGQQDLNHIKEPVGLSESDLLFDVTQRQISVEATRASLPDLSGFSTMVQGTDHEGISESTLHPPSPQKGPSQTHNRVSPDSTLVNTNADNPALSLSTNDSPESNTGITVPVNSPNITDSGGSSSRPNTDSYEYSDIKKVSAIDKDAELMPPPQALPAKVTSYRSRQRSSGHRSSRSQRPRSYPASLNSHRSSQQSRSRSHRSSFSGPSSHHPANNNYLPQGTSKRQKNSQMVSSSTLSVQDWEAIRPHSRRSHHGSRDWDSGCSTSHASGKPVHAPSHYLMQEKGYNQTAADSITGSSNMPREKKKALAKKLKKFSNNFYSATNTGNLHIETLGHF